MGVVLCGVVVPGKLDSEQLRFENLNGLCATVASLADHAEGAHTAQVDTPSVMDMTHASPDTWVLFRLRLTYSSDFRHLRRRLISMISPTQCSIRSLTQ
jgi:hypothetical protein